jgi:hypothetical protein
MLRGFPDVKSVRDEMGIYNEGLSIESIEEYLEKHFSDVRIHNRFLNIPDYANNCFPYKKIMSVDDIRKIALESEFINPQVLISRHKKRKNALHAALYHNGLVYCPTLGVLGLDKYIKNQEILNSIEVARDNDGDIHDYLYDKNYYFTELVKEKEKMKERARLRPPSPNAKRALDVVKNRQEDLSPKVDSDRTRTVVSLEKSNLSDCTRTVESDRTRTVEIAELSAIKIDSKEQDALYKEWRDKVQKKELLPSKRAGKNFISTKLCRGKSTTLTPNQMDSVMDAWQERALGEGVIILNPSYKNGRAKYLTV